MDASPFTVHGLLQNARRRLADAGLGDEAAPLAECALADALNCRRLDLALRLNETLTPETAALLADRIERLAAHEPLQYVVGWTEFYGRRFKTDARALIPRPETEELAERVIAEVKSLSGHPRLLDVGTGSGCLAVTLALECPAARIVALDLHAAALALARENAEAHGVSSRIAVRQGDLLQDWLPEEGFEVILANLPYVATDALHGLDRNVRDYEPHSALDGGIDGLDLIRRLVRQARPFFHPGGSLYLEIGEEQGDAVLRLLAAHGYGDPAIHRDLSGRPRIAFARYFAGRA